MSWTDCRLILSHNGAPARRTLWAYRGAHRNVPVGRWRSAAYELEGIAPFDNFTVMTVMASTFANTSLCSSVSGPFANLRAALPRLPIWDAVIAVWLVFAGSAIVYADEPLQDWIPDVLTIPDDAEVVTDRSIGSTVRMFSIATGTDVDALFADWEKSLRDSGYPITQAADNLLDRSIEFSGPGIVNAKIIAAPTTRGGRSLIEIDATLD